MDFRGRSFSKHIAVVVTVGTVLMSGCMITVVPDRVPMQKGIRQQDLAGVSLVVQSGSSEASPYPLLTERGVDVGFVADRQTWSRKLADALAGELARRGAMLRVDASRKLNVAVTEITLVQTGEVYQFKVIVSAASSRGWAKDYEASAEARTGLFESVGRFTSRLAGLSLSGVIKVMLDDHDFLAQISTP